MMMTKMRCAKKDKGRELKWWKCWLSAIASKQKISTRSPQLIKTKRLASTNKTVPSFLPERRRQWWRPARWREASCRDWSLVPAASWILIDIEKYYTYIYWQILNKYEKNIDKYYVQNITNTHQLTARAVRVIYKL